MSSMQEYLKRYMSDEMKKKKKKKKPKPSLGSALTIIDADPVWQKEIREASSESDSGQEEAPLVIEDVEFKRMQRLEALRMRPYLGTAEDGSGWVSLTDFGAEASAGVNMELNESAEADVGKKSDSLLPRQGTDLSPPRRVHRDSPSQDLSPPRRDLERSRHEGPELVSAAENVGFQTRTSELKHLDEDLSPPRKKSRSDSRRHDSPELSLSGKDTSPAKRDIRQGSQKIREPVIEGQSMPSPKKESRIAYDSSPGISLPARDLSPPRKKSRSDQHRHDSPEVNLSGEDLSPPRRDARGGFHKIRESVLRGQSTPSPKRESRMTYDSSHRLSLPDRDSSPPKRESRRIRHDSPEADLLRSDSGGDLSPPRRESRSVRRNHSDERSSRHGDLSPPRRNPRTFQHSSAQSLLSDRDENSKLPPRRRVQEYSYTEGVDASPSRKKINDDSVQQGLSKQSKAEIMDRSKATGLRTGKDIAKETMIKKKQESLRVKELDASVSGRNAATVYRDKHGKRLEGVDELVKLQKGREEKKEEKPLEWGKGLAQKREAEAHLAELEAEKSKPFATTREDLDTVLKEQIRWGDPMAHLIKQKKVTEPSIADLGASERMQESGFIIPQDVPAHSWLKRNIAPPPNRYGIKPGRHWDGVDRSTGFERDMYKRQNEKKAEQVEAYLWSVADM
ncbi:hypothetical protein KP509_14G040400 [Ceratopteris richardii]|uniref:BUD13 homolog n=1 Tax=Ceratopteris richardii TaxID=49495 RepID=A0A8T2T8U6_CERRI|nr:hypothetical protein KP509_14G040400 [Ceratopteris richardii]